MFNVDVVKATRRWIIRDYLMLHAYEEKKPSLRAVIEFTRQQLPHALSYLAEHKNLVNFQYKA